MIKALLTFVLFCFVIFPVCSQTGVPVIVKGSVLDEFTNKPVIVEMMFTNKDGKKFKIIPNSLTGHYEQVLNSGEDYDVTFINYDVVRETQQLHLEYSAKYLELEHNYSVKRMTNGLELFSANAFKNNSADLVVEGKELLDRIVKTMRFSRGAKLQIKISAKDADKSKNSKELIENRIKSIFGYDGLADVKSRISISASDVNTDKNLTVIVTEISDPLKN